MLLFLIFGVSVTNGMHFPLVYCLITQGVQPKPRVNFFNIFFHGLHNKQKQVITCFLVFLEGENGRDFQIFYQLRVEKGVMVQIPLFLSIFASKWSIAGWLQLTRLSYFLLLAHLFPCTSFRIPTVAAGNVARWVTEIYEKESSATPQRLVFSRFDVEELDTLLTPGTFVDAYLSLDPYDYQQNAGIRLVAKKLIVHSNWSVICHCCALNWLIGIHLLCLYGKLECRWKL